MIDNKVIPSEEVKIFGSMFHTHDIGKFKIFKDIISIL